MSATEQVPALIHDELKAERESTRRALSMMETAEHHYLADAENEDRKFAGFRRLLLILLAGLVALAGLIWGTSQADAAERHGHGHDPVTLCHKPGSPAEQTLTVDKYAVQGHLGHGDTLGACPAPFESYTVSVRWVLPATWPAEQTPPGNVAGIWPQTRLVGDLACGRWSQDDTYLIDSPEDEQTLAGLGDELVNGEDSSLYQSHTFTYGGDCEPQIPPAPEPYTEYGQWSDWTVDCDAGYAERGRWSWSVTWEWDGTDWQPVLGEDVADLEQRDLTAEESAACEPVTEEPTQEPEPTEPPTTVEPTEPPMTTEPTQPPATTEPEPEPSSPVGTPEPTTEPTPTVEPTASSTSTTRPAAEPAPEASTPAGPTLAETGIEDHTAGIGAAITLLLFGAGLVVVNRIRGGRR